ncbi:protein FANTASTIC FOUR 3-like [Phoenix dactylifera]|uniref:Protein FANTASTIC FOUR 3-like n=1 Tax=Phoenix dactylifera TaxID=42345 RepID=A0A8B9AU29_PHODC|nr:protein FANTASTIC FOUR 3-like [Phoenix dactylifera]
MSSSSSSSSSSSVCQGIQSFVEPRQIHPSKTKPEIHKCVRPSRTHQDPVMVEKGNEKEMDGGSGGSEGGWSSIYSLSTPSQSLLGAMGKSFSTTKSSSPLPATIFTKRSTSGKKNWAMCTENLGCETGAVYAAADDFDGDAENRPTGRPTGGMVGKRSRRGSMGAGFPPPLTTLSGESRLRILSKRENGRLLLLPVKPSVMEAERADGRLRLRLYSDKPFHSNDKKVEELEEEEGRRWGLGNIEGLVGVKKRRVAGTGGDRAGDSRCSTGRQRRSGSPPPESFRRFQGEEELLTVLSGRA